MKSINTNFVLDAKGLACPLPVVRTRKAMNDLLEGQVLEVQATDKGSKADLKAWSKNSGHQYLGLFEDEGVLKHYIRKAANDEVLEKKHPLVTTNEELAQRMNENSNLVILDVREEAEYAFNHIPNAISIPLGELEQRFDQLKQEDAIYVVCRSGSRSDFAAQFLAEKGFSNVINVIPGMSEWAGETVSIIG